MLSFIFIVPILGIFLGLYVHHIVHAGFYSAETYFEKFFYHKQILVMAVLYSINGCCLFPFAGHWLSIFISHAAMIKYFYVSYLDLLYFLGCIFTSRLMRHMIKNIVSPPYLWEMPETADSTETYMFFLYIHTYVKV